MRVWLAGLALWAAPAFGQSAAVDTVKTLDVALAGDWVGVLEYRDYREPANSTKRVDLPTWLRVAAHDGRQTWHFVYDDGPDKTLDETEAVTLDPDHASYTATDNGKPAQVFKVVGYDALKSGRGTLVLSGNGTDASKPAEFRVTLTIRRNLLEQFEEVRPAGSQEAFVFRHLYRFVRREAPAVTAAR